MSGTLPPLSACQSFFQWQQSGVCSLQDEIEQQGVIEQQGEIEQQDVIEQQIKDYFQNNLMSEYSLNMVWDMLKSILNLPLLPILKQGQNGGGGSLKTVCRLLQPGEAGSQSLELLPSPTIIAHALPGKNPGFAPASAFQCLPILLLMSTKWHVVFADACRE